MKCLILAGGFATRLYPLTLNRAKALLEYAGKPIISHIVDKVPRDIDILVAANRKFEKDFIEWQKTLPRRVELCIEEARTDGEKLGAVGAVDHWIKRKRINHDLMIIAADNYFDFDLRDFVANFGGVNATVAVYDVGDKEKACDIGKRCQLGLVQLQGNRVVRFDEKPEQATSSIIATGVYILPSRVFGTLKRYCEESRRDNLGSFLSHLIGKEEVHAYIFDGMWVDIGDEIRKGRMTV